jgi:uncharacterized protein YkwD
MLRAIITQTLIIFTLVFFSYGFGYYFGNTTRGDGSQVPFILHQNGFSDQPDPQVLESLVNSRRIEAGLPGLEHNPTLCPFARTRAAQSINNWSHQGFEEAMEVLYFQQPKIMRTGENLVRDYKSDQERVDAWMASPSHRKNILDPFTSTCVECVNMNCAQIFAL